MIEKLINDKKLLAGIGVYTLSVIAIFKFEKIELHLKNFALKLG